MTPRKYTITLDQLRMAKKKLNDKTTSRCYEILEKVLNAMEAADYNYRPLSGYMHEYTKCVKEQDKHKTKPGTMYYLNQYLDQRKHKKK